MNYDTVGPEIYPSFVGVARDDNTIRPDVPSPIEFVPTRHRELEQIDCRTGLDVLEQWTFGDVPRRHWRERFHAILPQTHEIQTAQLSRNS